jgi:ribosomal protein S12
VTPSLLKQDEVLIAGFGKSGKAKGDIAGVRFKVCSFSLNLPTIIFMTIFHIPGC